MTANFVYEATGLVSFRMNTSSKVNHEALMTQKVLLLLQPRQDSVKLSTLQQTLNPQLRILNTD